MFMETRHRKDLNSLLSPQSMSVKGCGFFCRLREEILKFNFCFYILFLDKIFIFTELTSCKGLSLVCVFVKKKKQKTRGFSLGIPRSPLTASAGSRMSCLVFHVHFHVPLVQARMCDTETQSLLFQDLKPDSYLL